MRNHLRNLADMLRTSLWFVPACIVAASVALALLLIELEPAHDASSFASRWPMLFGGGAEGCRGLLTSIAGSMVTVAGVTFSITMVAMTLAASQYTSRILRNFMRDRANQAVLGVFVGVFAYCLVVLRRIRTSDEGGGFVPGVAVLGALLLAFVAIGFLIFFIHHAAASIQATSLIDAAARETLATIDRLYPERGAAEFDVHDVPARAGEPGGEPEGAHAVLATANGYLTSIDLDDLRELAARRGVVLRLAQAVGGFAIEGCPLVWVAHGALQDGDEEAVRGACTLSRQRTMTQDAGFGIRQIVDVALKALSPGIHDPTTAITCIDHLTAILARLATRDLGPANRGDGSARCVITVEATFGSLLGQSFDQIRNRAADNAAVLLPMLRSLRLLHGRTRDPTRRQAIAQQARWIVDAAERGLAAEHELRRVREAQARLAAG